MQNCFAYTKPNLNSEPFEIIEVKGAGHPDTLADTIADAASQAYSYFTSKHFGAILRHNFDKLCILGGKSEVNFGESRIVEPVRLIANGRAVLQVADVEVPAFDIVMENARKVLGSRLKYFDLQKDLVGYNFISTGASPGAIGVRGPRSTWFSPLSSYSLPADLHSNDTSASFARWPLTEFEQAIIALSESLTLLSEQHMWLGTDTKIMGVRGKNSTQVRLAVPQIALETRSIEQYKERLNYIYEHTSMLLNGFDNISIKINARDKFDVPELYLTATGSSIESGDEGVVGRGNRLLGCISVLRPSSMEGISGKNPTNHIGKVYSWVAAIIAKRLHDSTGGAYEISVISSTGSSLTEPMAIVAGCSLDTDIGLIKDVVTKTLSEIPYLSQQFASSFQDGTIINPYFPPVWNV